MTKRLPELRPKQRRPMPGLLLLAAVLMPLLLGCAHQPTPLARPPVLPPLPQAARQPDLPTWCPGSCTDGLTIERENWRKRLTGQEQQGLPAKAPTGQ